MDFYAAKDDLARLLQFLFEETDSRVYESYSEYDRDLREFRSVDELADAYPIGEDERGDGTAVLLQLWSPAAGGTPHVERIELSLPGQSHRYRVHGWGLMQLDFGGRGPAGLSASHFGHNSEARARRWQDTYPQLGPAELWDWRALARTSRRIQYHVRRHLAEAKLGSRPVCQQAEGLWRQGVDLI